MSLIPRLKNRKIEAGLWSNRTREKFTAREKYSFFLLRFLSPIRIFASDSTFNKIRNPLVVNFNIYFLVFSLKKNSNILCQLLLRYGKMVLLIIQTLSGEFCEASILLSFVLVPPVFGTHKI